MEELAFATTIASIVILFGIIIILALRQESILKRNEDLKDRIRHLEDRNEKLEARLENGI